MAYASGTKLRTIVVPANQSERMAVAVGKLGMRSAQEFITYSIERQLDELGISIDA